MGKWNLIVEFPDYEFLSAGFMKKGDGNEFVTYFKKV